MVSVSNAIWPVKGDGMSAVLVDEVVMVTAERFEASFEELIALAAIFAVVTALLASLASLTAPSAILVSVMPCGLTRLSLCSKSQDVPLNDQVLEFAVYVSPFVGEFGKSNGILISYSVRDIVDHEEPPHAFILDVSVS